MSVSTYLSICLFTKRRLNFFFFNFFPWSFIRLDIRPKLNKFIHQKCDNLHFQRLQPNKPDCPVG